MAPSAIRVPGLRVVKMHVCRQSHGAWRNPYAEPAPMKTRVRGWFHVA